MSGAVTRNGRVKIVGEVPTHIMPLLKFVGVLEHLLPIKQIGFWKQESWRLDELLAMARKAYKERMKEVFPKLHGADGKAASLLNVAMERIESLFERGGAFKLDWIRFHETKPRRERRIRCQNELCGCEFVAKRNEHKFCNKKCMWAATQRRRTARKKVLDAVPVVA